VTYDSAKRVVLCNILIESVISTKLVRPIKLCLNKTYGRHRVGKMYQMHFLFRLMKEADALSPYLFKFALEYAIRRFQKMTKDWNLIEYVSSWSVLTILIYTG